MKILIKIIKLFLLPVLNIIKRIRIVIYKHTSTDSYKEYLVQNVSAYNLYKKDQEQNNYNYFKKFFKSSIFLDKEAIRKFAIEKAIANDFDKNKFYLEFGVFNGTSINFFAGILKEKIYGFDSFMGLRENWEHNLKGAYDSGGKEPKVRKNVILVKGLVQETIPKFLSDKKPAINFIHMDLDTYESTKFVLEKVKPYLAKKSIIIFDQIYNHTGWEEGELKALTEVFKENEYRYLSFAKDGCQAVLEIY